MQKISASLSWPLYDIAATRQGGVFNIGLARIDPHHLERITGVTQPGKVGELRVEWLLGLNVAVKFINRCLDAQPRYRPGRGVDNIARGNAIAEIGP